MLRAVNVGGTGKLPMAELRRFFGDLGFGDARTYIQTGNVIFECGDHDSGELETLLEEESRRRLGLDTSFIVRSPDAWGDVIAANPFPDKASDDPRRLLVMALKDEPSRERFNDLREGYAGPEPFSLSGKHLYIDYLDGAGNSKLTNTLIERKLGTRGTARNWNTVLKLAEMAGA